MDGHQLNCVCSFVDLTLAFATSNCFKLFNVAHKVANQVIAGAFEARCQSEQPLNICQPLCPVKVCRDHGEVF